MTVHRIDPLLRWDLDPQTDCWLYNGSSNGKGYGGVREGTRTISAHTYFYERVVGPVPDGLYLDHLCRVRRCVNPDHLEPVTMRENLRRGEGWAGHHARGTDCGGPECRTCQALR